MLCHVRFTCLPCPSNPPKPGNLSKIYLPSMFEACYKIYKIIFKLIFFSYSKRPCSPFSKTLNDLAWKPKIT